MQSESLFVGGINDGKTMPVDDLFCTIELTVGNDEVGIIRIDYYSRKGDDFVLSHQEHMN